MMKNPVAGRVKTRLANDIGNEKALKIYLKLLQHTHDVASKADAQLFLFYSDTIEHTDLFGKQLYKKYAQCSGDLGARMEYAFSIPFKSHYKKVVIIGTDCYDLTPKHLEDAFAALTDNDFVIGPAKDGGYYLLGMKRWHRWIFHNKSWSTAMVFSESKNEILSRNAKLFLLEELTDIDTFDDLQKINMLIE
jgi:rSAM/selenodomain-associated transferase 1